MGRRFISSTLSVVIYAYDFSAATGSIGNRLYVRTTAFLTALQ
jgi:hypothetical protein